MIYKQLEAIRARNEEFADCECPSHRHQDGLITERPSKADIDLLIAAASESLRRFDEWRNEPRSLTDWISVEDRLPEDEQGIVGLYGGCEYHIWLFRDDWSGSGTFYSWNYGFCPNGHLNGDGWEAKPGSGGIAYWMPLPTPPEVKS